ncbi:hypothetical protein [Aquimarina sp. RZ0]|uniref:hypothetical protein n=1 Tax=Aquimarina sp. RZ0 TaxID=2607730 RepID=UPI0011F3300C|nr:hypothetical protein [Aquimarina sp. RZ0]KAA1243212.1 hypothetical protein F0000_22035 [Aquimarina sp. RZ0]
MKNSRLNFAVAIATIIGFFVSCNKEEIPENTQTSLIEGKIELVDGVLKFDSEATFENTLRQLINKQNSLDEWEKQFSGFTSMRAAFDKLSDKDLENIAVNESNEGFEDLLIITESDGELEIRMNIDDLVLATIANQHGLVLIDDYAYKIRYNTLYKIKESSLDKIVNIDNAKAQKLINTNEIESFPVSHQYYDSELGNTEDEDFAKADRTCNKRYWKKKRKRLKGEQWTTNIGPLYSGAGARTKHQKRSARIWFRNKTKQLRLKLNGSYTQYFEGIPITQNVAEDSGWQNDDGREAYLFDFCINANCSFTINNLSSTHECICDDNNYLRCDIIF